MVQSFAEYALNESKVKVADGHVKVRLTSAQRYEYQDTFIDTIEATMPDDYYGTLKGSVLTIPRQYIINTAERMMSLYDPNDDFGSDYVPKRVKASLYKLGQELLASAK